MTKYAWSGPYNTPGSAFGWLYEFSLQAAAGDDVLAPRVLRGFGRFSGLPRKNLQAILLLATAFIILLGQTFAGYWLTALDSRFESAGPAARSRT